MEEDHVIAENDKEGSMNYLNNSVDIKEVPLNKQFSSAVTISAKQFLFYTTEDKGKSFLLKNDTINNQLAKKC